MQDVVVIIPTFNEIENISKMLETVMSLPVRFDVLVVDDNSTDGTDEIARGAGAIVRYEYKQGKGNVIRRMFRDIDAECYIMIDGDDTYPAEAAPEMVKMVFEQNADMVVGDRLSSTYWALLTYMVSSGRWRKDMNMS